MHMILSEVGSGWGTLANWVQVAIATIALIYAGLSLKRNWRTAQLSKTVDAAFHCSRQYDNIHELRNKLKGMEDDMEMKRSYFSRYWAFINDQFDLWLFGVLDHDTFFDLLCNLSARIMREKNYNLLIGENAPRTLEESWRMEDSTSVGMRRIANPQFRILIENLFRITNKYSDDLKSARNLTIEKEIPNELEIILKKVAADILTNLSKLENSFARRWRSKVQAGLDFEYFHEEIEAELKFGAFDWGADEPPKSEFKTVIKETRRIWSRAIRQHINSEDSSMRARRQDCDTTDGG